MSWDYSVKQAFDLASNENFNEDFDETALYTGFTAVWPMWDEEHGWHDTYGYNSTMAVYGNGNIHLYEHFVHEVVATGSYGYGAYVENENNIIGGRPNDQYAHLHAEYYGEQAVIVGSMWYTGDFNAHGNIYLHDYSGWGYNTHLYVWVSPNNYNWYYVSDQYVWANSPCWIDCGLYSSNFRYIAIAVYNADWWEASCLYVDTVLVIPPLPQSQPFYYYVSDTAEYENGGAVDNHENLRGIFNDGNYAHIHCSNPPDAAWIIGTMNAEATGHIEIYGCSGPGGYYSDLYVYVSYDYQNWYLVTMLTITETSPYWIYCGYVSSPF